MQILGFKPNQQKADFKITHPTGDTKALAKALSDHLAGEVDSQALSGVGALLDAVKAPQAGLPITDVQVMLGDRRLRIKNH